MPLLLEVAAEDDPDILEVSVGWLPWFAPKDPAIPALVMRGLKHKDVKVRIAAVNSLGRKGVQVKEAIPLLIDALKDPSSPQLRWLAADALGEQGAEAKAAIPALMRALDKKDLILRANAARALALIEPREARAAVPLLIRSLDLSELGPEHNVMDAPVRCRPPARHGELERAAPD
jgi:HEAT repeat protein